MNILFVTPRLPLPVDTGAKIRTYNLLKEVIKNNRVCLLSFYFEENKEAIETLKNSGVILHIIKAKEGINLLSFFNNVPVSIEKYRSKEFEAKFKELVSNNAFDLIHFDHLHMGQYKDCANGVPCVLDEHNVESVILERCAAIEKNPVKRVLFKSQAKKMSRFESRFVTEFSKCLVVSESDKQNLYELSGRKADIVVITNGVDTEFFSKEIVSLPSASRNDMGDSLVFTGSMDWLPNNDAVIYFCREILPLIWKKNNQVKFYAVGKNPAKELLMLASGEDRIIVTGAVEDVRPYIARSKIFVVPIRIGGGTRLKILEAMAMEKAVISTTVGAEGIMYTDRKDIVLADDPQLFADKVIELLNKDSLLSEMGKAGRDLVCAQYDWNIIGKKLMKTYEELR